jgi:tetratricopeptide (TPR) repeat protein
METTTGRPRTAAWVCLAPLIPALTFASMQPAPPGDADPEAPPWKRAILRLARDHDDRLRRYEKALDQIVNLLPGEKRGPAEQPMVGIAGVVHRLIEQQRGSIALDRQHWTGVLKAIEEGTPSDGADRFRRAVADLLASQEAHLEKYRAIRAELVEGARGKVDPASTARAEALLKDAREFLGAERDGAIALLEHTGRISLALGRNEEAWWISKRAVVLRRQWLREFQPWLELPEFHPRLQRARLALADADLLLRSARGKDSRMIELDRIDRELDRIDRESARGRAVPLAEVVKPIEARLDLVRELMGEPDVIVLDWASRLAVIQGRRHENAAAAAAYDEAVRVAEQLYPPMHPLVIKLRLFRADARRLATGGPGVRSRVNEIETLSQRVVEGQEDELQPLTPDILGRWVRLLEELLGAHDPAVSRALELRAETYHRLGDIRSEETDLRAAVALRRRHGPAMSPELDELRLRLAEAERFNGPGPDKTPRLPILRKLGREIEDYRARQDHRNLATALKDSQRILADLVGDADPLLIPAWEWIAEEEVMAGRWDGARIALDRAAELARRCYGPSDWRTTNLLRQKKENELAARTDPDSVRLRAAIHSLNEQFTKALNAKDDRAAADLAHRVASLYASGGDDEQRIQYLQHEASLLFTIGDLPQAESVLQELLAIEERLLRGKVHPVYAWAKSLQAKVYFGLGRDEQGLECLREAYAIRKKTKPESNTLRTTAELIMAYAVAGQRQMAEEVLADVLQHRAYSVPPSIVQLEEVSSLGEARLILGDEKSAVAIARHLLAVAREYGDGVNPYLVEERGVVQPKERGDGPRGWLGPFDPGSYAAAARYLSGLTILRSVHLIRGEAFRVMAISGRHDWVAIRMFGGESVLYASRLDQHIACYLQIQQYAYAAPLARRAAEIVRKNMDLAFAGSTRSQQLAMTALYRAKLDAFLTIGLQASLPAWELYREVLRWKGAVFEARRRFSQAETDPRLAPTVTQWRNVAAQLVKISSDPDAWADPGRAGELRRLDSERERLEGLLSKESGESGRRPDLANPTLPGILASMPPGSALVDLIEYGRGPRPRDAAKPTTERRLVAFVVRHDRRVELVELGPSTAVDEAVARWRIAAGADPPSPGRPGQPAQEHAAAELKRLVWDKLAVALDGCTALLVSPDGALAGFPFGALPGQKAHYLIDERSVELVPVPRLLAAPAATRPPAPGAGSLLLVSTAGAEGQAIHGAVALLDDVVQAFGASGLIGQRDGDVERLVGPGATRAAVSSAMARRRVIVLLVHGDYLGPRPGGHKGPSGAALPPELASGLRLADGRLSALEVGQLDLTGTELVVLAACESARG